MRNPPLGAVGNSLQRCELSDGSAESPIFRSSSIRNAAAARIGLTEADPGRDVFVLAACLLQLANLPVVRAQASPTILFEGARLIVGDGTAAIGRSP